MDAVLHKPFTLRTLAATLGPFLVPPAAEDPITSSVAHPSSAVRSTVGHRDDLFDREVIVELQGFAASGRSDFVKKVFTLYRENAPRCIADLRTAAQSGIAEGISEAAHALKSMSYSIGAKAVAAAAGELEMASLNGAVPDDAAAVSLEALLTDTLIFLGSGNDPAQPDERLLSGEQFPSAAIQG
jgi:two-component system sensor histidine kinase BarA